MTQIHKKFSGEQVKLLFSAYEAGHVNRMSGKGASHAHLVDHVLELA